METTNSSSSLPTGIVQDLSSRVVEIAPGVYEITIIKEDVPPSIRFECKGYRCTHVLIDKSGFRFTI